MPARRDPLALVAAAISRGADPGEAAELIERYFPGVSPLHFNRLSLLAYEASSLAQSFLFADPEARINWPGTAVSPVIPRGEMWLRTTILVKYPDSDSFTELDVVIKTKDVFNRSDLEVMAESAFLEIQESGRFAALEGMEFSRVLDISSVFRGAAR